MKWFNSILLSSIVFIGMAPSVVRADRASLSSARDAKLGVQTAVQNGRNFCPRGFTFEGSTKCVKSFPAGLPCPSPGQRNEDTATGRDLCLIYSDGGGVSGNAAECPAGTETRLNKGGDFNNDTCYASANARGASCPSGTELVENDPASTQYIGTNPKISCRVVSFEKPGLGGAVAPALLALENVNTGKIVNANKFFNANQINAIYQKVNPNFQIPGPGPRPGPGAGPGPRPNTRFRPQ